ncbi:NAD(P)-binding protein [Mollisia scopiformis]|uniref:NAD(P)-binding protein n=1 Tax=Mollisia scopiformis TaxID=149040 RepID=A0A132B5V4_MOLSC|nr:NAD(P)-binding protein [Mollisia scopiformis]KUJ07047.1 NAD(P)-binding protein [Mollisia scopiformis]
MPIHFFAEVVYKGIPWLPDGRAMFKLTVALVIVGLIKWYSMGASNTAERQMHGKIVMITGGTSGIGAATALRLAQRGAQIILLVHQSPQDIFLVDFIEDLREKSGNEMIYAEQVDLSSLYSVRQFATRWIDNAPPRRLDMIILCAATLTPAGKPRAVTSEGLEEVWMVNYLSNFHLLSILSPAIRAQPPDRDIRILFATCSSYITSPPIEDGTEAMKKKDWTPTKAYARSKLALMMFGLAFQKHLDSYQRPDGAPVNARVLFVDPGYSRTPGMRRWLTRGTLWGLALYLVFWQNVYLILKSSEGGAQSFLYAAMDATFGRGPGGKLIKECQEMDYARTDIKDETAAKKLWEASEKLIERVEREEAVRRALEKKEQEKGKSEKAAGEKPAEQTAANPENKQSKSRRQKKAK